MYKIRLTDSIEIDKFKILKPEVELEFDDSIDLEVATEQAQNYLQYVCTEQMTEIAKRVPNKEATRLTQSVNVDLRFRKLLTDEMSRRKKAMEA